MTKSASPRRTSGRILAPHPRSGREGNYRGGRAPCSLHLMTFVGWAMSLIAAWIPRRRSEHPRMRRRAPHGHCTDQRREEPRQTATSDATEHLGQTETAQRRETLVEPVPRRVRNDHGQHDHAEPLGHDAQREIERGHEQDEHEQLAELDADVEREQRRQHVVRPRTAACFAKRTRSRSHGSDRSRTAMAQRVMAPIGCDDVLDGHVEDRRRDQRLDERRKPQRVGRQAHTRTRSA